MFLLNYQCFFLSVSCAGQCQREGTSRMCYSVEEKCDGKKDCTYGQDEMYCENEDEPKQPNNSGKLSENFLPMIGRIHCLLPVGK